ncbi:MAG: hypothetical protein NXY59_09205 [Aigarchaeota archaeon]|nr:hypothetical protein [Candidatus Pelearchaeum maunauluense]
MLFRRVSLNRKTGEVRISGRRFYASALSMGGYLLEDGQDLLNVLSDVRFEELPKDLTVVINILPSEQFHLLDYAKTYLKRNGFSASITIERSKDTLIDVDKYIMDMSSSLKKHGFDLEATYSDERVTFRIKYPIFGDENIGHVLELFDNAVTVVNRLALEKEGELDKEVRYWIYRLDMLNGHYLSQLSGITGIARWLLCSLTSGDVAYILLGIRPISLSVPEKVADRILNAFQSRRDETINRLILLGMLRRENGPPRLACTSVGARVKSLIEHILSMREHKTSRHQLARYDPLELLNYIARNFAPLAISKSRRLRRNREGLYMYANKMLSELTFIHVAVLTCLYWRLDVPESVLEETFNTLTRLGFISYKGRINPFGEWLVSLVKGYLRKSGLRMYPYTQKYWSSIFDWGCLYGSFKNAFGR